VQESHESGSNARIALGIRKRDWTAGRPFKCGEEKRLPGADLGWGNWSPATIASRSTGRAEDEPHHRGVGALGEHQPVTPARAPTGGERAGRGLCGRGYPCPKDPAEVGGMRSPGGAG
jgi:hypothetical protein